MSSRRSQPFDLIAILFFLTLLLLSSLTLITLSIRSIPFLKLPTSLHHVTSQIHDLKTYSSTTPYQFFHLITILSILFIWKQAFSIPGTILLNILIGAIYGTFISTILTCFLTAIGSTCAYQMARSIRPFILRFFPTPLNLIQRAVDRFKIPGTLNSYDTVELSCYLLLARFLPVVPYAALNLASGVLELPLLPFFWTLVIGSLPYNLLTTQVGDILSNVTKSSLLSDSDHPDLSMVWSNTLLLKLALISLLGALPVLFKQQLRESIQALVQSRRFQPSSLFPNKLRGSSRSCVFDIGSEKTSTLSVLGLSNLHHHQHHHPINSLMTPSTLHCNSSAKAPRDHADDESELSRTTSSCSLSTQEDRFSSNGLAVNFSPLYIDENYSTKSEPFSTSYASFTNSTTAHSPPSPLNQHDYNTTDHHLPLFITQNSQSISKSNSQAGISHLSIHSLFDLPYRKVTNIVSENLVLPK